MNALIEISGDYFGQKSNTPIINGRAVVDILMPLIGTRSSLDLRKNSIQYGSHSDKVADAVVWSYAIKIHRKISDVVQKKTSKLTPTLHCM